MLPRTVHTYRLLRIPRLFAALCAFLTLPLALLAEGRVHFKHIGISHGLPHNNVMSVLKDSQGFVWMGTEDGLARYNGYDFEVFKHNPIDTTSLGEGLVYRIMEDSKRNLWVGTNCINLFNRESGTFTHYNFDVIDSSYPHSSYTHAFLEDSDGELWVATYTGLYLFRPEDSSIQHYLLDPSNRIPQNTIRAVIELNENTLLVGTNVFGAQLFCKKTGAFSPYTISGKHIFEGKEVFALHKDRKGRIWLGSRGDGLAVVDEFEKVVTYHTAKTTIPHDQVYAVKESTKGDIWIGTDAGLCVFRNGQSSRPQCFSSDLNDTRTLSSNSITNLHIDNTGIIWVSTRFGGVSVHDPYQYKFKHVKNDPTLTNTLSHNFVTSFTECHSGNIYIGTDGGGLNTMNPSGDIIPSAFMLSMQDFTGGKVQDIGLDSSNNIWIALWGDGVLSYNPSDAKINHYTDYHGLSNKYILSLMYDSKGCLWAGTWKDGPFRLCPESNSFEQFPARDRSDAPLRSTIVNSMLEDSMGFLWFGTQTLGLYLFNPANESISRFHQDNNPGKGINNNTVLYLYQDSKGLIWVCTNGGGVNLYNPTNGLFSYFTTDDELPSNVVYAIVEDNNGLLWITTNQGVVRARVTSDNNLSVINRFDISDGLQGDQFSRGAIHKTSNGMLLFGGQNGFNTLYPDSLILNTTPPPVFLTGLSLFNKPTRVGEKNSPLTKHITELDRLVLRHDQSVITFTYAALNYSNTNKNSFAYYLEPFENNWNYVGSRREATYTNLNPGKYTLRIKASNNDNVWNEEGVSLEIIILPPWWQTLWFRISFIAFIVISTLLVFRMRVRFLMRQKEELQKLVDERTKALNNANLELLDRQQEITQQNEEITQQNEEIMSQYEQIQTQKDLVEDRNQALEQLNEQLNEYKNNLEALVEERTRELLEAKLRAEESDRLKTSFLTNISHEVRTPLNAIIGFADIVCNPEFDQKEKADSVEVIRNNCDYLLQLIEDIIDISKIEIGQVKVSMRPMRIADIFEEIKRNLYGGYPMFKKLKDNSIEFISTLPDELAISSIDTDPKRLRQIIFNLIGNAFKYTKGGEVEIGCDLISSKEVRFYVRDTGIGIKPENVERIFNRFMKIEDDSSTSLYRGAGIGLTLVKPLVELLGGRIWVESEYGVGSTFSFTHPISNENPASTQTAKPTDESFDDLTGLVVLVVEDELSNMFLLESFLKKRKAEVYKAWNGQEAVDMIASHEQINLVLLDLKMPVMDGFEAYKRIREIRPSLTVIAQTAMVMADEIEMIEKSGFNDYIIKPISFRNLVERLSQYRP